MNKNQCGKLVAVLSGLIFVCSASAMDQAQSATTGAEHTSNDAPHAAQRAAQMKRDPLPADDFAGLNYTSGEGCTYTLGIWKRTDPLPRLSAPGTQQEPWGEFNEAHRDEAFIVPLLLKC